MKPIKQVLNQKTESDWAALPQTMLGWFEGALRRDDPKPSLEACYDLGQHLRLIVTKCLGVEPSPSEWERNKIRPFMEAANRLLVEAEKLEETFGSKYPFQYTGGEITLAEIQTMLGRVGAIAAEPSSPSLGRDKEVWHLAVRDIARAINKLLKEIGCSKVRSAKNAESAAAIIGAKVVNWFFKTKKRIQPAGFASALKPRPLRRKGTEFKYMFPDAMRQARITHSQIRPILASGACQRGALSSYPSQSFVTESKRWMKLTFTRYPSSAAGMAFLYLSTTSSSKKGSARAS